MQIQGIHRSLAKSKPKLLTLYQGHSYLAMLSDFQTYCWVHPQICDARHPINIPNMLQVSGWEQLDFDLCVNFSGGITKRILTDIAKARHIDIITYEMDSPIDIGSDLKYRFTGKNGLFTSESHKNVVHGNGEVIYPPILGFACQNPMIQRRLSVCTYGDNLKETESTSHFSDWHEIINTLPGCQIFGHNPRLGTFNPDLGQLNQILNDTKIYLNTKTGGYFPLDVLQAMTCGCVVISYNYPGIDGLLPKEFIVKNKKEARALISELVTKPHLLPSLGEINRQLAEKFKFNGLAAHINKEWENICEFGYKQYRV